MTSDRVKYGLRGPVKSCTDESIFRHIDADGKQCNIHSEFRTEYDFDGHMLLTRHRNPDGSYWLTRFEYGDSGQMLKSESGTQGSTLTETHYTYDDRGRLQKITTDGKEETPVSFRYDERGQRSKIEISRAEDYRPNVAAGGSPFEAADHAPNLPGGGTATTLYDEQDRATEVQVRNANGELVSRALRAYAPQGRVVEEKQIVENLMSMFPPEINEQLQNKLHLSPDQLRQELAAQLAGLMAGPDTNSVQYRYDSAGLLTHTSRNIFNHTEEIETTYNKYGDPVSEIRQSSRPATPNDSTTSSIDWYSEVLYSYEYDQHGNWTQKALSSRSSSDGTFQPSTVINRSLDYY